MARKPTTSTVETVTPDPIVEAEKLSQPVTPQAPTANVTIDGTAVETGTVATIGHNQPTGDMPTTASVHDEMVAAIVTLSDVHKRLDNITQRLAYLIMKRHMVLAHLAPDTVGLHICAVSDNHFQALHRALTDEFYAEAVTSANTVENAGRKLNRTNFMVRIKRALRLACDLSWDGYTLDSYDHDKSAWAIQPSHFVAPGYIPQMEFLGSLQPTADGPVFVPIATRHILPDDSSTTFFCNRQGFASVAFNLSVRQYAYAVEARIRDKAKGSSTPREATPAREAKARGGAAAGSDNRSEEQRKQSEADNLRARADAASAEALAAKAKASAADADVLATRAKEALAVASQTETELGTPPVTPEGEASRIQLIADLVKALVHIGTLCNRDQIATIGWSDITVGAQNGATDFVVVFDRWKGDLPAVDNGVVKSA